MTQRPDPILWAEHAVIANVVRDSSKLHEVALEPKNFTIRDHQVLWESIIALESEGEPVDAVTVAERADTAGCVGVLTYLTGLLDNTIELQLDNYRYYARMIWSAGQSGVLWRQVRQAYEDRNEADIVRIAEDIMGRRMPGSKTSVQADLVSAWQEHVDKQDILRNAPPYAWGLADLDRHLGRLVPGRLNVIMARPGIGKTAMVLNVALHNAKQGTHVGFISLEQGKEELAARAVCILSGCSLQQVIGDDDTSGIDQRRLDEAKRLLPTIPMTINDGSPMDVGKVRSTARRLVEHHGAKIIIIDYLQTIRTDSKRERHEEVADNVQSLKTMARQLDVPVIVLAQARRDAEGKRPTMSDLKDSSVIEAEADLILALHRDTAPDCEQKNVCEVIVLKNRHGESNFGARISWQGWCFRFADLTGAYL